MYFAGDWFDDWQRDCFSNNSPDASTMENYHKLCAKCEDWAIKKRLDMDTKNSDAMDIGGASGKD